MKRRKYTFEDEVIFMAWAHFGPKARIENLTCLDCEDSKKGFCPGEGRRSLDVVACMAGKVIRGEETILHLQASAN